MNGPLPSMSFCCHGPQRGTSLLEVLIATLVISVGILALAGLMGTATRLSKTSEFRATATLLAADLADRLRANVSAAEAGHYELLPTLLASSRPARPGSACTTACEAAQIAAFDLAQWQAMLFNSLPAGTGYLSYNSLSTSADLWIMWRDPTASDSDHQSMLSEAEHAKSCPPSFARSPLPVCMHFRLAR